MRRAIIILSILLIALVFWDKTWERGQASTRPDVAGSSSNAIAATRLSVPARQPVQPLTKASTNSQVVNVENEEWKTLSDEQVEFYLLKTKRSAESLVNAFLESRNTNFLNEAATNFPENSIVQLAVLSKLATPEERSLWLEKLKISSPDNALPHYLSALDQLKAGNMERALGEIDAARGKESSAFEQERILSREEMYLLSGYPPREAKQNALETLVRPELAQMKGLAQEIQRLQEKYLAAGDHASIQELAAVGVEVARKFSADKTSPVLIDQLVGFSMERIALKHLDAGTYYDFLGKTPGERIQEINDQKSEMKDLMKDWNRDYSSLSDAEKLIYLNRSSLYGEMNAMRWLKNRR